MTAELIERLGKEIGSRLWPILGGNHTDAETWHQISDAVEQAIEASGIQSLSDRIAVLQTDAQFLCERLRDFAHEVDASDTEDIYREFHGHVEPALARLEASLTPQEPK